MGSEKEPKLTARQRKFCERYLVLGNASEAARDAGYSEKTAGSIGAENLTKPEIREYLASLGEMTAELAGVTRVQLATQLRKIATADLSEFVSFGPDGVIIRDSSDVDGQVVAEVAETKGPHGAGSIKIKLHDKLGAIQQLTRMFGWNAPDKTEVSGPGGGPIEVMDAKTRLAERLARLAAKRNPEPPG